MRDVILFIAARVRDIFTLHLAAIKSSDLKSYNSYNSSRNFVKNLHGHVNAFSDISLIFSSVYLILNLFISVHLLWPGKKSKLHFAGMVEK